VVVHGIEKTRSKGVVDYSFNVRALNASVGEFFKEAQSVHLGGEYYGPTGRGNAQNLRNFS